MTQLNQFSSVPTTIFLNCHINSHQINGIGNFKQYLKVLWKHYISVS